MGKEIIVYGDIETENREFHRYKNGIFLKNVY